MGDISAITAYFGRQKRPTVSDCFAAGSVSDAYEADIFDESQSVGLQEAGRRLAGTVFQAGRQIHSPTTGLIDDQRFSRISVRIYFEGRGEWGQDLIPRWLTVGRVAYIVVQLVIKSDKNKRLT